MFKPTINSLLKPRLFGDTVGSDNAIDLNTWDPTGRLNADRLAAGTPSFAGATVSAVPVAGTPILSINDTSDHVINATESASVEFSVSGLTGGAAGAVTFTDSGNHQVVVDIQGNGTYSADLSTLTDGTIASSLSATGPSGSTTSAAGNAVTLDTDRGLTPTVAVNGLDPAHVTFTISGLEGDESGTMTFTDINGKQVVVDVGSNGDYSANLSSLAQGPVTYLVSEMDPAGNAISFDPPITLGDGSAGAAAGTPQVPNLLSGYAVRAPWQVAGVDYAVGINAGTVLKNPLTINMAGVSIDATSHVVFVTGNNVVLDGWNFTGWGVDVTGQNATVRNSDFTQGVLKYDVGSVGGTIEYNKFDQAGTAANTSPFMAFGSGTFNVQYNDFENSYNMAAQFTYGNGQGQTIIFQYNLIQNTGGGSAAGAHGDWIQIFGVPTVYDAEINYNTVVQNKAGYLTQGWSVGYDQQTILSASISNNTMVVPGGNNSGINYAVILDSQWINGTVTIANNYSDMTGASAYLLSNPQWPGPYTNGTIVTSNDVNMVTGGYIYPPAGGGTTATAVTTFSTDSNVAGDHITNDNTLTLTGTAPANSTVKVFDGSTQIGSTTANASGVWSYNTATLADGSHSFTIAAVASGTTTTSAAFTVTVDTKAPSAPTITSFSPDTGTVGDGVTTASSLTLSGSAEANSTVKVLDGTTQIGTATANGSGAWSFTTSTLSSTTHAFTAVAMDAAGNTSGASAALNVTVNAAPTAPGAPAAPNLVTNGSFETGNFSGWTLGGNYATSVYGPQTSIDGNEKDGQYAANIGAVGSDATLSQTLQTTAGQQYTLSFWLANQGSGPNDFTVKWNGTTVMALANAPAQGYTQYTFTVTATGATSVLEFDARQDPSHWDLDSISVTAIGTQGSSAPTITSFSPDTGVVGDGITDPAILTLTGTAVANSTVKVYDGTTLLGTATANASGAWSFTTVPLPDGVHSFTATDTVSGVTSAASVAMSVTVDTVAPVAPSITAFSPDSGTVGDHITNASTLTLTGTAEANATVKIFDGATLLGSAAANGSGAWSFTTGALSSAAHSFTATATDAAGNTGVASAALSVTIDTTAPVAPTIAAFSPDSGVVGDHITNASTLTLTGTAEANSTVKIFDGATLLGSAVANGSGAWSFTTGALSNAAHSFTATATDAAANTSVASAALAVTIDTTAPVAPSIAAFSTDSGVVGDHITNDNTLTLTGTAEANATVKVYDGTTLMGSAVANGSGAWNYTTGALSNAAHSFTATATDAAGNTGVASAALAVTIDTTAPVAPSITAFSPDTGTVGDGITSANILTLTGTAEANATVKVYDGTTLLGSAVANGSGAWSFTTGALSNAAHSLTATATDAAGNTGVASVALAVTVTAPPGVPTIASFSPDSGVAGDHITNATTLTLTGSAVANSTVNVYDGVTLLGNATANGSGAWSYTTAALANGVHSLTATDTVSGVTSAASVAMSVTVDTVAPVAPSITTFSPDSGVVGDHITNASTLTLTGTAEANATVKIFDGATLLGSAAANGSGAWSFTTGALSSAAHSFTATATDAAGNTGVASAALSVTIDTTAPVAPTIAAFSPDSGVVGDHITNASTLTLTGTAEANSTVKIFDGATLLGSAVANGSGAWSFTTGALSNAAHSFTATATDAAANTSVASAALAVTIDTTAPVAPSIAAFSTDSGVVGDHITNDNTLTLTGTAEANATVKVYDGTTLMGSAVANGSGAWNYTTGALSNAAHSFTATATDAAGNTGVASAALAVTIDTTAPVAPSITAFSPDTGTVGDGITSANILTLTGTAEANATVKVYDGTTLLGSAVANGSGAWSFTTGALSNAAHSLTATATDAAGNTGVASVALAVTVTAPPGVPTIASFSPDSGVAGDHITNATTLTLTGSAVANSTVNVYDGVTLLGNATANGSGAWSYTTAALANGVHSLTATDTVSGVTSAASVAMSVTVDTVAPVAPSIASFSTDSGVAGDHITDDSTLTLTGTAEANATVKIFDGATLLGSAAANGSGAWSYTTAALADGAHSLTATATDAASNTGAVSSALSVTIDTTAPGAPSVTAFSPDTGTVGDGITLANILTLTGTAEANAAVKIFDGATLLGNAIADGSGAWSYTTGTLTIGTHSFTATDSDAAGNASTASAALNVSVALAPIAVSVQSFTSVAPGLDILAGTSEANNVVSVYNGITGAGLGTAIASTTGAWNLTLVGQSNSVHDFIVKASNQTGNPGSVHVVYGTTGNDTIANSAPNEFLFGNGGNDTFVFSGNVGQDTVADFNASTDVVQLSQNTFANFAAVLAHATQTGPDVTIAIDPSNSITLHNTTLAQLTNHNIHIV